MKLRKYSVSVSAFAVLAASFSMTSSAMGQVTHVVGVDNFVFTPAEVTAAPGDTIRWELIAGFHTITSGSDCTFDGGAFDEPSDPNDPIFEFVIPQDSENIPYFCRFHCVIDMTGLIIVEAAAKDAVIDNAVSIRRHGAGELPLAIDLEDSNGIESRLGGITQLHVTMSEDMDEASLDCDNLQINCAAATDLSCDVVELNVDLRTLEIHLLGESGDANCCTFGFDGMQTAAGGNVADTLSVSTIAGDVDFSGAVTGGDASLIKPHFGEIAGVDLTSPKWDFDTNGGVTGGDFALIKPRFGNIGPACP